MKPEDIPVWITYLSALLTPIVAIIGASIAYQQWLTARNKLKLDLFEKRHAVYEAVASLIYLTFRERDTVNEPRLMALIDKTLPAKFLFDEAIDDYVWKVKNIAYYLGTNTIGRRDSGWKPCDEDRAEFDKKEQWMKEQTETFHVRFVPFLRLSH